MGQKKKKKKKKKKVDLETFSYIGRIFILIQGKLSEKPSMKNQPSKIMNFNSKFKIL